MRSKLMFSFAASAAVMLFHPTTQTVWAQSQVALTGTVSSDAEGNMEGVVVTAKKPSSIVQVSVTTDAQGRYAFPENRLDPGEYTILIRAVGYDINAPTKATGLSSSSRGWAYRCVGRSSMWTSCRSSSNGTTVGRRACGLASPIVASASSRSD